MVLGFSDWYPYAEIVEQCSLLGTVLLQCVSRLQYARSTSVLQKVLFRIEGVSMSFHLINIRFQVVKCVDSFGIFNSRNIAAIKSLSKLLLPPIKLP